MSNFLPYGRQSISEQDISSVLECLRSPILTVGPRIEAFEKAFAQRVGAKYAVAVCNATAALHLAMLVAGIGPKDRVVTSPITFLASANCAAFVGAIPDFADVDPVSLTLCPKVLEANWKPDTRAVVAVDYAGQSADMPAIAQVARKQGAIVIEDACHAVGGSCEHQGEIHKIGGHPWADMTTFSFHPVKTMTTGEGGMLVTDNEDYAQKARLLRSHGIQRNSSSFESADACPITAEKGPWFYEMKDLGYNFRLTEIQAALGLSQLAQLDGFIQRRREIVSAYNEAFKNIPWIQTPDLRNPADQNHTAWHLYSPRLDFKALSKTRTQVMNELREQGVGTQVLYIPVHLQPWYRKTFGYA
ncbi:MAG: DegT/DnrJ/EryC1/StrS family aminotransferase, partial [Planctomycetota bacterium]|nr:DegT/DnrJ/EryC1/StrS family aminotransferase [Planctomycetota bacterium]